ncbi:hypothetical protein KHX94_06250 [Shewanella dokdonensis]|uniref:Flagellar assembly protein T middle domain-containing protein n=1 Tax=Shewanella dokdonensis TaxID=712036 RepID=A0ABX8DI36_9GAMM|nr:flagella assembly protein FlgT middle domain-containing protein [Shewanella dokdonensis]QVK24174.1 hypothetical protein KHX94_06250 [Shewanella dokdonensis]
MGGLSHDKLVREFGISMYLIDGISGLTIMKKDYHTRTYWPFPITKRSCPPANSYGSQITD